MCRKWEKYNPCNECGGQGNKQTSKKISVTIPKGVDDGTRIRLAGKGEAGTRGGTSGDLYLFINVDSHELFKRSDVNLFYEFPISVMTLGTTIEVPTIDGGKAKIKIRMEHKMENNLGLKEKACHLCEEVILVIYIFKLKQSSNDFKRKKKNY